MLIPPDGSFPSARSSIDASRRKVSEPAPLPVPLEAQLLREKRARYGQAVREELARKAQASKEKALQARLASTPRGGAGQVEQPPSSRSGRNIRPGSNSSKRDAAPRQQQQQQQEADALQAILTVVQKLEDRLNALPACPPHRQHAVKIPATLLSSPSPMASPRPWSRHGRGEAEQSPSAPAGSSPSMLSSMATPSTSAACSTQGSIPSAWGLHASKKLSKLLRLRKQAAANQASEPAGAQQEVVLKADEEPPRQANMRRYFNSLDLVTATEQQQPSHTEPRKAAGEAGGFAEWLLQLEAEGDPFSIINIYLEEQWERQQQARQRKKQVAAHQQCNRAAACGMPEQQPSGMAACARPEQQPAGHEQAVQEVQQQQAPPARHAVRQEALPPHTEAAESRPISAASDQENVSQNLVATGPGRPPAPGQRPLQGPLSATLAASARGGGLEALQLMDRTFQAEFERLMEMHEVELELAQLAQAQLVGAAHKEMDSLAAALEDQVAMCLLLEADHSPDSPAAAIVSSSAAPAAGPMAAAAPVTAPELAGQQLQLMSMLHFSQQQQLAHLQHLSQTQQQQQQQLQQIQCSQPPGQPLQVQPPTLLGYTLEQSGITLPEPVQQPLAASISSPRQQHSAAPAVPSPRQSPLPALLLRPQQLLAMPAFSPEQRLQAAPSMPTTQQPLTTAAEQQQPFAVTAAAVGAAGFVHPSSSVAHQQLPSEFREAVLELEPAGPAIKHQYVQQWLDGAESEDQYSLDPDHVEDEPSSGSVVPADKGTLWLGQQGASVTPAPAGEQQGSSPPPVEGGVSRRHLVDGWQTPAEATESQGDSEEWQAPAEAAEAQGSSGDWRPAAGAPEAQGGSEDGQSPAEGTEALGNTEEGQLQAAATEAQGNNGQRAWEGAQAALLSGFPRAEVSPTGSPKASPSDAHPKAIGTEAEQAFTSSAASVDEAAGQEVASPPAAAAQQAHPAWDQAASSAVSSLVPMSAGAQPSPVPAPMPAPQPPPSSSAQGGAAVAMPAMSSSPSVTEYSMSFEDADFEDAEFSYSEQHTTTTLMPLSAGAGMQRQGPTEQPQLPAATDGHPAAAAIERPASPRLSRLPSAPAQASRPTSPPSPRPRPLSPHALDDKYPLEAGDTAGGMGPGSMPGSPLIGSRPSSPLLAASGRRGSRASSPDGELLPLWQEYQAGIGMHQGAAGEAAQMEAQASAAEQKQDEGDWTWEEQNSSLAAPSVFNPPVSPGSPRVDDDTVVQTEGHAREYLGQVMDYFWAHRAQAYMRGEQPLDLEGFLHLECQRQPVGDPQHIFNKLLYDAANEALAQHYNKTLTSFAGKVAPEQALLDRERVSQLVVSKVVGWAGMGCTAADVSRMLAEDAAEEERSLALLTDVMQKEIGEGRFRAASPLPRE